VFWELEMEKSNSPEMQEILASQKEEANNAFCKYVEKNYAKWIAEKGNDIPPIMSHNLMEKRVFPALKKDTPVFFILLDNLRYDQWKSIQPYFTEYFKITDEEIMSAVLPTTTQYSRNAIFAGMTPLGIEKKFPVEWKNDDEDGGKNLYEEQFFQDLLKRKNLTHLKTSYTKITNTAAGEQLNNDILNLMRNDLNIIVYNFVDMLSHARTEMEVLKELAGDSVSYRSLTQSWFEHSTLWQALKKVAGKGIKVIVATDHGSVQVTKASKIIADKQSTSNIRYKHGKNLQYDGKEVIVFKEPNEIGLPKPNFNSSFVFAKYDGYLCYPNNYNHYVNFFKNTFQHGGISLEELLVPFAIMETK
jgi:PglZ domain.